MSEELCVYQGKPVQTTKVGLFSGRIAADLAKVEEDLPIDWDGAPMHARLWDMIKAFMLWTYEEHKTEGQLRLYYSESKRVWTAHPMPQYIAGGLFTEEVKNSDAADKINAKFNPMQWQYMGTVHHHCGAGAFQSGTDHRDELTKTGLHVTLGHVNSDVWDIHARCCLRGLMYTVKLEQWLPTDNLLTKPTGKFPSHWKDCLMEKPKTAYSGYGTHGVWHQSGWDNEWFNSRELSDMDTPKHLAGGTKHRSLASYANTSPYYNDEITTKKELRRQIERVIYTSGADVKRYLYKELKDYQGLTEDTLDGFGMLYDTIEGLINMEGIDSDIVLNYMAHCVMDMFPSNTQLCVDNHGQLTVETVRMSATAKKEPEVAVQAPVTPQPTSQRVLCIACGGTGYRSQDPRRGTCGICNGEKYILRKDYEDVLRHGNTEVPF